MFSSIFDSQISSLCYEEITLHKCKFISSGYISLMSNLSKRLGATLNEIPLLLQLLRIEEELGADAIYAGASFRAPVEPY